MQIARLVWFFSLAVLYPCFGFAQSYPSKPVRIVMSQAGSGPDVVARLVAQGMSSSLGQPVVVDNRAGIVAVDAVAKAPPDGYTLVFFGPLLWLAPFSLPVAYDPVTDFAPITLVSTSPNVLVVHPSVPVKSVKELIALAKAQPGVLNYSTGGTGSSNHLAAELFKSMAGLDMVRIAHKGTASANQSLVAGQTQLMFPDAGTAMSYVRSGKLRALAVTSAKPSALAPGLPTLAQTLPGYESLSMLGIFAPSGTPQGVIKRLNQEIVRVLNNADTKGRLLKLGVEPVGSSPEQFAATVKSEMAKWGKLIKGAGSKK